MDFYTADLHFGHGNVIKYDQRPFSNVDEMDREIIKNWNSRVTDKDRVFIVGDLIYKSNKDAEWYLKQLKGQKYLIIGNHDRHLLNDSKIRKYFVDIDKMMYNNGIIICHYPIAEWDGFFRGNYHIYGHIHNNKNDAYNIMKKYDKALNAGCMINNYMPVTLEELIINNKIFKENN